MSEPADDAPSARHGRAGRTRRANREPETAPADDAGPPPEAAVPPDLPSAEPLPTQPPAERTIGAGAAAPRRAAVSPRLIAAAVLIVVLAIAATPFWAPPVIQALPWGQAAPPVQARAPAAPAPSARGETAPDPGVAAIKAQAAQSAAAVQLLGQRLAALESKPPPDLGPIQQQLAAVAKANAELTKANAELATTVAALQKAAQSQPAADPNKAALALALLQIREAVEVARPFDAEYRALVALARDHPEIAAAAKPLAEPAASGVASRAALVDRLRQSAPEIATAKPPPKPGWKSQIVARLRSLVTIRRLDGDARNPAEAAVATAQRDMATGDLAGAVEALSALSGPSRDAAEPWLRIARQRLAVETALRQVAAAVTVVLGTPAGNTPAGNTPAGKG
jgi:hypothetical protein